MKIYVVTYSNNFDQPFVQVFVDKEDAERAFIDEVIDHVDDSASLDKLFNQAHQGYDHSTFLVAEDLSCDMEDWLLFDTVEL